MLKKKVAILQSNYIPWKGYFDLINVVDEFVVFDDVQYTKNDWRNRNIIKTKQGLKWLTIPVQKTGRLTNHRTIRQTKIIDKDWNKKHWDAILFNYSKAKCFSDYSEFFKELYLSCNSEYLSEINLYFLRAINNVLNISTKLTQSNEYNLSGGQTEKLISICQQAGASEYVSGPAAKDYIKSELFKKANIKLTWMDYQNYPEYNQLFPPFEHKVTILDLLFNEGQNATKFMKSFANK